MRRGLLVVVILATWIWLTSAAHAGGWATVTLDALPGEVHAGQALTIGFMVRQHGQTPINSVGPQSLTPYLLATHTESKTAVRAEARQSGAVGHFVVEVTFPRSGAWTFKIVPAPFPDPTAIGLSGAAAIIPLEVRPPLVSAPGTEVVQAAPASATPTTSRGGIWLATGGILGVALGLTLLVQRGATRRRTAGQGE